MSELSRRDLLKGGLVMAATAATGCTSIPPVNPFQEPVLHKTPITSEYYDQESVREHMHRDYLKDTVSFSFHGAERIQQALREGGYTDDENKKLQVDGRLEERTFQAFMKLQKTHPNVVLNLGSVPDLVDGGEPPPPERKGISGWLKNKLQP